MIHSTLNYLKNSVTIREEVLGRYLGKPISTLEETAQFFLGLQHVFFSLYDPENHQSQIYFINNARGESRLEILRNRSFSRLDPIDKLLRITMIAITAIVAVVSGLTFIPIGLAFHHIAMARDPKLRQAFDKLNDYDYRPELILVESNKFAECSNRIATIDTKKNERFFQKTPKGISPFELICQKYRNNPNNADLKDLLFKMILHCPKRDYLMESLSDGSHWLTALPINNETKPLFQLVINSCTAEEAEKFLEIRGFNKGGNLVSTLARAGWNDLFDRFLHKFEGPLPDNFYVRDAKDQTVLDLLIKANRYDYIKETLFSENQAQKWNLLFGPLTQLKSWPDHLRGDFLEKILTMDADLQRAILMHQDSDGNTLLHKSHELFNLIPPHHLGIPVLLNRQGLTPAMCHLQITKKWLAAPKPAVVSAEIKRSDYNTRATNLQTNVLRIWVSCAQDLNAGRINRQLLWSNRVFLDTASITQTLRGILNRIVTQQPGGGAPTHGTDACYSFLSEQIVNFETIYAGLLRTNNPAESAAVFIDIAKVALEGNCARGVNEVIEQKAQLYPAEGEEMTFEVLFDKKIVQWLKMQIQVVYSKYYEPRQNLRWQNVHHLTKLKQLCKLTNGTDGYFRHDMDEDEMWGNIQKECTFLSLMNYLNENVGPDMSQEYLKSLAPAIHGRYKEFVLRAKDEETEARHELELQLRNKGFNPKLELKLAIQNVKQANFPVIEPGQNLIIAILKRKEAELKRITGCQDLDLLVIYDQVNGDYAKVEEAVIDLLTARGLWNNQMRMRVRPKSIESSLRTDIEAAKNFQKVFDEMGFGKNYKRMNEVIVLQKAYRAHLERFVYRLESQQPETDDLDLSWDKFRYPLPSQAWEANYRTQWAAPFMASTSDTIRRILGIKGVIAI